MGRPRERILPEIGAIFGKWKVKIVLGTKCLCQCQCGTEKFVYVYDLLDGKSTQCRPCACSSTFTGLVRLDKRNLPWLDRSLYRKLNCAAVNAISRCISIENPRYDDWGGRGITVYAEWLAHKVLFMAYLASLPGCADRDLVLDRIDNDGNYEPGNLRFVTRSESQFNRRERVCQKL